MRLAYRKLALPKNWPKRIQSALLCAIALARTALIEARAALVEGRAGNDASIDSSRLTDEVAMLREELRIKDARLARIGPAHRPHYSATERLSILVLKAARGWNAKQTANVFFVSEITISNWLKRLDEPGCGLVALRELVNRFPDFIRQVVQQLKCVCPTMGKVRIAQLLARTGLQLSPSTVRRFLRESVGLKRGPAEGFSTRPKARLDEQPAGAGASKASRSIVAKRPHHVWHVDLTLAPTHVGFWVPWFPFFGLQCWPFGYCVAVVVDHFSRKAVAIEVFKNWPSSDDITSWLDVIIASIEQRPTHLISDQGVQFRKTYGDWCAARGIKPRFGTIGQHGSIAIVERFILSLKNECTRRILVPLRIDEFRGELFAYCRWFNAIRPHQSRGGRTPSEVAGDTAAAVVTRFEPRLRLLESNQRRRKPDSNVVPVGNLHLDVTHFEGRAHLPVVRLDWAA